MSVREMAAMRMARMLVASGGRTRDPIDQNYIAVLRDDWEFLQALAFRLVEGVVPDPTEEPSEAELHRYYNKGGVTP